MKTPLDRELTGEAEVAALMLMVLRYNADHDLYGKPHRWRLASVYKPEGDDCYHVTYSSEKRNITFRWQPGGQVALEKILDEVQPGMNVMEVQKS
jgi:hypothetical protein